VNAVGGPRKRGSLAVVERAGVHWKKYRRSAMEKLHRLQCKALQRREKRRSCKNNGKQWKNNANNNGSNEKYKAA
jgi:hypothetical protein